MRLDSVSFKAGSATWLYPFSLDLVPGEFNVVLGSTRSGKTTLLRILAGLERVSSGSVSEEGVDVTRTPVRDRSVAMVYQQFINYPSLTVYENIASPLRVARRPAAEVHSRVTAIAETLRLTPLLARYPAELSGGQQQRVALGRAMAKDAKLLLLDEPLANLDYKLREELRGELPRLFARQGTTVVYATTEPQEALQLGGHIHLLESGRLLQSGPTLDLFRRPATLVAARVFSDPPLNVLSARVDGAARRAVLFDGSVLPLPPSLPSQAALAAGTVTVGLRPHRLALAPEATMDCHLEGTVDLAEVSGSETYVHVRHGGEPWVAQLQGVHRLAIGQRCRLHFDTADLYWFDASGALLAAPQ